MIESIDHKQHTFVLFSQIYFHLVSCALAECGLPYNLVNLILSRSSIMSITSPCAMCPVSSICDKLDRCLKYCTDRPLPLTLPLFIHSCSLLTPLSPISVFLMSSSQPASGHSWVNTDHKSRAANNQCPLEHQGVNVFTQYLLACQERSSWWWRVVKSFSPLVKLLLPAIWTWAKSMFGQFWVFVFILSTDTAHWFSL